MLDRAVQPLIIYYIQYKLCDIVGVDTDKHFLFSCNSLIKKKTFYNKLEI